MTNTRHFVHAIIAIFSYHDTHVFGSGFMILMCLGVVFFIFLLFFLSKCQKAAQRHSISLTSTKIVVFKIDTINFLLIIANVVQV